MNIRVTFPTAPNASTLFCARTILIDNGRLYLNPRDVPPGTPPQAEVEVDVTGARLLIDCEPGALL